MQETYPFDRLGPNAFNSYHGVKYSEIATFAARKIEISALNRRYSMFLAIQFPNLAFAFNPLHASLSFSSTLCFVVTTIGTIKSREIGDFDMPEMLGALLKSCLARLGGVFWRGSTVKTAEFEIHAPTTAGVVTIMQVLRQMPPTRPLPKQKTDP